MKQSLKHIIYRIPIVCLFTIGLQFSLFASSFIAQIDSTKKDSAKIDLRYPFNDNTIDPTMNTGEKSKIHLSNPSNVKTKVEYDPEKEEYNYTQTMGKIPYRNPTSMSFNEYTKYDMQQSMRKYWKEKASGSESFDEAKVLRPQLKIKSEVFDRIFGSSTIDIQPQGSAELIFGVKYSKTDNPALTEKARKMTTFDFDEKIQLSVTGKIGDKMELSTTYNTEATFDFDNKMKLEYEGKEDEIIKKIEAGNVSFPLNSTLITGSQSLFGIKTKLQFGRLMVTSVLSQQKGKKQEVEVKGGAKTTEFEVKADNYEANKHYFLAHFFRDQYDKALSSLPFINSGIIITKIEVWITNTSNTYDDTRNILVFQDLGEGNPTHIFNSSFITPVSSIPDNTANDLYGRINNESSIRDFLNATATLNSFGLVARQDYQKIELARQLKENEYTVNTQLGYISLNRELNTNQVLAVAFQYTYNGKVYQVGDFSSDGISGQNALYLKMLKSTENNTSMPMWDLMMKNVYNIGAYRVQQDGFMLHVWYLNQATGVTINYIPEGKIQTKPLIQVLGLDNLNVNQSNTPDGVFDFIENVTINTSNGRVFFPSVEPFGSYLRKQIGDTQLEDKYAFDSLYTTTQANAEVKYPDKNRFILKGEYQSSASSEISLNAMNVPEGSVTVTAGGRKLIENMDYTVDYTLGRVKIMDEGILESGTPIKVSLESQSLFNIQSKTFLGSRFDYTISDKFLVGGTLLNLTERPFTQKINIGDEPISNTVWGLDINYSTESQLLTSLVDKIPLIDTKEKSSISFVGEFAQLIPGHSKAIGKSGTSYIDDFEGSQSNIDIKSHTTWKIASTPQGQPDLFPEGELNNNLAYGFNRAKLAWYVIDPSVFFRNSNITPEHIKNDLTMQSNHFMREIDEVEVFPNKDINQNQPNTNLAVLDLAYYPTEKGPYNYDVTPSTYSSGIDNNGDLLKPETRWAGIMRRIETQDFDAANVEFIQFWLMDPFNSDYTGSTEGGELYFNIGYISEDILRDARKNFEHGLPTTEAATSNLSDLDVNVSTWGRTTPPPYPLVDAFDNNVDTRPYQDVGLDGLRDQEEKIFFDTLYLKKIENLYGTASDAYAVAKKDPSSDNFTYFQDDRYDDEHKDILQRYKKYNGLEGNTPTAEQSAIINDKGYPTSGNPSPDIEDINRDKTMDETEAYYQYKVKINPQDIDPDNIGNNYITDFIKARRETADGKTKEVYWYQFKIPIQDFEKKIGGIQDFRSIQFMRMFMKGFKDPVVLRFARLDLIRGAWRKFAGDGETPNNYEVGDAYPTFNVSAVNIEENGERKPVNYVLPPDIEREIQFATSNLSRMNEQSLAMEVCDLEDGKWKACYKSSDFDIRSYKRLRMYVHAEAGNDNPLRDGELSVFIRLGTDFEDNYYEYEIPLAVTPYGNYNPENREEQLKVWPESNSFDIELAKLQTAKSKRNASGNNLNIPFSYNDGKNTITIVGNPSLSDIRTIMIGVRNPAQGNSDTDDGGPKCAEVWFNELRLSDFDEKGGWATTGRISTQLADLGKVNLAGSISTPGYGSIEKKVSERQKETIKEVDVSSTMNLEKFTPEKYGLKIPMYVGFYEGVSNPQYDPLEDDILMKAKLDAYDSKAEKDEVKDILKTLTIRRSINFTNVRKEKRQGGGAKEGKASSNKSHIYDIENISLTYSFSEQIMRDFNTEHNKTKTYRGAINYNFSPSPKNIIPFGKSKLLDKSKYLKLIKDFNFYTLPKQLSFSSDIIRSYSAVKARNNNPGTMVDLPEYFNKNFTWDMVYSMKFDITKSIQFDFSANNKSLIEEPDGIVDKKNYEKEYTAFKDTVWQSIREFGTNLNYHHTANLDYTLPLKAIPLTDWINATVGYGANYDWKRAPFTAEFLGNTIQNTKSFKMNGQMNMTSLYNKVPYFKKIDQKYKRGRQKEKDQKKKKEITKKPPLNAADSAKAKQKKERLNLNVFEHGLRLLMSFKNVSGSWTKNYGTLLPGYDRETNILGFDPNFKAPGLGFLFGQQNNFGSDTMDFAPYAASKGWLRKDSLLNTAYMQTFNENISFRATADPLKDMRLEINASKIRSRSNSSIFKWDKLDSVFVEQSPMETGNYSVSYGIWRTAFSKDRDDHSSEVFEQFLANRKTISQRLGKGNHSIEDGYSYGNGSTSQKVLLLSFLSAYSKTSTKLIGLYPFKTVPKPNWRITYSGLSKIEALKKIFRSVSIDHAYRSTFSIASYNLNLNYDKNTAKTDANSDNYITEKLIDNVTVSEQFSPLIGVNTTWKNSVTTKFEIKKDRQLALSFANNQITEVIGKEIVVGVGYRIPDVSFPLSLGKLKKKIRSDLNLRADVSFRNNKTVIRKIVEEVNQATAGQNSYSIKISADYAISSRLNLRFFYEHGGSKPVISTSFPTTNINSGISIRFSLA